MACVTQYKANTSASICVDVTASIRRVYVRGTTSIPVMTMTVTGAELWQYSTTSGWVVVMHDDGPPIVGVTSAEYYGTAWPVQFGHVYESCANVRIAYGSGVFVDYYAFCSGEYAN